MERGRERLEERVEGRIGMPRSFDLDFADGPTLARFDYAQCRHEVIHGWGKNRHGREQRRCIKCGRLWSLGAAPRGVDLGRILLVPWQAGYGIYRTRQEFGFAKDTIRKYFRIKNIQ